MFVRDLCAAAAAFVLIVSAVSADDIDDYVLGAMETQRLPAVSFAVINGGEVVDSRSYGLANLETRTPAEAGTVYAIGSVTKSMTAIIVMMLVQDGMIALDDPIGDYVQDIPRKWRRLKIRELLSHTSGVSNADDNPCHHPAPRFGPYAALDGLKEVSCLPLEAEPGQRFLYASSNYILLGMLVEAVTQKAFSEVMRDRLFVPLGMMHTQFLDARTIIPSRASGYAWEDGKYVNAAVMDLALEMAGGGVLSTTADVTKFVLALGEEDLLSAESWSSLWTPPPLDTQYALGFGVSPYDGNRRIGHNGAAVGFASSYSWFADSNNGIVVLSNGYQEPLGRNVAGLSFEIARLSGLFRPMNEQDTRE